MNTSEIQYLRRAQMAGDLMCSAHKISALGRRVAH